MAKFEMREPDFDLTDLLESLHKFTNIRCFLSVVAIAVVLLIAINHGLINQVMKQENRSTAEKTQAVFSFLG